MSKVDELIEAVKCLLGRDEDQPESIELCRLAKLGAAVEAMPPGSRFSCGENIHGGKAEWRCWGAYQDCATPYSTPMEALQAAGITGGN